jgi:hypothetical protein
VSVLMVASDGCKNENANDYKSVGDGGYHIKVCLKNQREIREDAPEEVDSHLEVSNQYGSSTAATKALQIL